MKFNFKIQQYQTDAVDAVVKVFNGQGYYDNVTYRRDIGKVDKKAVSQTTLDAFASEEFIDLYNETGFKNEEIDLTDEQLLKNIRDLQSANNITQSDNLVKNLGRCSLDVEMETGTGKTYVYIKTMFELNKRYGWSKFIVVVPSIAIREGVKKSFEIMQDHFMEHYGKKARFFVYNSSNLNQLDNFSQSSGINVMIINTQAFATSLKEDGKSKEARIIYDKRDEFASRRPIDVIAANRPIIILDEPQKMGKEGSATQKALKRFNPLFTLNYSATHATEHNMVYVLDALDAYNKKLVKRIEVKGFEIKNLRGTNSYLYLDKIVLSQKKPPMAKIELEVQRGSGIKRETFTLGVGDNLYHTSKELEQYKENFTISNIDAYQNSVTFLNGETIYAGNAYGDVTEKDIRRIQIRETILSHFEKEKENFDKGIKTLSLFFIDEVANYRQYDEDGNELLGEYGQIFEEEYSAILASYRTIEDTPYQQYLNRMCTDVSEAHKGYFSIDKKGKVINSEVKKGKEFSDDISAYDLILKNKERLLSFDEPTRFIFSHSALREGWDNPNVFQICTLKHSSSTTGQRQEVGRGLRLCVNQAGNRMDAESCGGSVHDINVLTVIASESYKDFVKNLQADIKADLYEGRPKVASIEYFTGAIINVNGEQVTIAKDVATEIYVYLRSNGYVDKKGNVTELYRTDSADNQLEDLPDELLSMTEGIHTLVRAIFDESALKDMFKNAKDTKPDTSLNDNFYKKEFQTLWKSINHKYAYTVEFDSNELITKSIKHIDEKLFVSPLMYTVTSGAQKGVMDVNELERGDSFGGERTRTSTLERHAHGSRIKYDLIDKIAVGTTLTRKTVVEILKGIKPEKFSMFKTNPEEFINRVIRLIKEQKATMIVEHIEYNQIEGEYDSVIFTAEKGTMSLDRAVKVDKSIQDYIMTDSTTEKNFAKDLESSTEVCVYAKLPKGFAIPTPVGNYSPDWAIAFNEGSVKHIFFVAETKGTMETLNLKPIEQAKISCAKKLFNDMSTENIKYHDVDSFQSLMNIMSSL